MKPQWLIPFIFLLTACASTAKTQDGASSLITMGETQTYRIKQTISIVNAGNRKPEKQNLWVALIRDFHPYQNVISRDISPAGYILITDEYGNQYAEFDLSDHAPNALVEVEIIYEVSVNEIIYDLSFCSGNLPDEFIQPELHIESANPQIISLAAELSKGKRTACAQVRAFYDYAGDELYYAYNRQDWGAQATFGQMGSDCSEYASLVAALSRAESIPARYYEGLLYLEERDGENNLQIAQTEHAWLDAYLPGIGWTSMDPTMGRWATHRETYFAHHTPDHIIVTMGRNPSTLRGASYWSHIYWPGNSTIIRISKAEWEITPLEQR
ncbi:MAG TPA: transglutaminase domain-containing protein [Anaerolineales bacterium]|nr:transglutaminase domain-containing protein [Anaerolineales bacterium]